MSDTSTRIVECPTLERALHLYETNRGRFRVKKPGESDSVIVSEMLPGQQKRGEIVRQQIRAHYQGG